MGSDKRRRKSLPMATKFWRYVKVGYASGCWLWCGAVRNTGYGSITNRGSTIAPHRYAYETWRGLIPKGMNVCHTCDVRHCVNPKHMFLGSQLVNIRDMIVKGRRGRPAGRGEKHRSAKLTSDDVREIRISLTAGVPPRALANKYGISIQGIYNIRSRKTWQSLVA